MAKKVESSYYLWTEGTTKFQRYKIPTCDLACECMNMCMWGCTCSCQPCEHAFPDIANCVYSLP